MSFKVSENDDAHVSIRCRVNDRQSQASIFYDQKVVNELVSPSQLDKSNLESHVGTVPSTSHSGWVGVNDDTVGILLNGRHG